MRAFLDEQPLAVERPTLRAALAAAVREAGLRGRIVVEATRGGAPVPDCSLESPPDDPIGPEDVRFVSVEPRSLVSVTLSDAADALDGARANQLECARLIQTGQVEAALGPLGKAIETWRAVRDAIDKSVELLGVPTEGGSGPDPSATELASLARALWTHLEEVRRSLSAQDWSALSDALAYDMNEQVDQWRSLLRTMSARLAHATA